MAGTPALKLSVAGSIGDFDAADWDACANPGSVANALPYDPFVSHAFLAAAEMSGSACAKTGWSPCHLRLEEAGATVAVMPLYLKSHSRGEYVFDHGWASAFERAGGHYYPKLLAGVPFTPVTGRRLLTRATPDAVRHQQALVQGCRTLAQQSGISSVHVNFAVQPQWELLGRMGFLLRTHQQFHWHNAGYRDFDDFLEALAAKKRKNIRRERRLALADQIEIERLTGSEIREHHWDAFFSFYLDTGNRKWGSPYLTRTFFSLVGERMADRVLLVLCKRAGRYIGGAINFIGGDCLFGRNWGCIEQHDSLHFEACYYQAIEFAIERGLARVEAGAQGEHKLARGYLPSPTYSAHWIAHDGLRDAVGRFLEEEREHVRLDMEFLEEHSPYRQSS